MKKNKIQGFTLPEMLISLSLGLFLSIMLIKVYLWQDQLQRQMQDMIFLDHNGILVMQMLANKIRSTNEKIKIIQNGSQIEIQESYQKTGKKTDENIKTTYFVDKDNQALRRTRPTQNKNKTDTIDLISGVDKAVFEFVDDHKAVKTQLHLTAPDGMTEVLKETVYLENYFP